MAAPATQTVLRRAFVDIVRGYSTASYLGKPLYIRHLTHHEHTSYDEVQARYEASARAKEGQYEAERLAQLKADGRWTDAQEAAIAAQRETIARFDDTIRNTPQPSVVASLSSQVEGERAKLTALLNERSEALGMTCEAYALRMVNDYYVVTNLFRDAALTEQIFSSKMFDDMDDREVQAILKVYHAAIEPCEDSNLRQLAVAEFFTSYFSLCGDDVGAFYGRPIASMTYYQVRLANIARYFRSIMEQVDLSKVPASVRGDPDAIERLYTAHRNLKAAESEGKLPGGMSQQDIEQSGLKGQYAKVQGEESAMDMVKRLARTQRPS